MTTAYLPGSAWETWTNAGIEWRKSNPVATMAEASARAKEYAVERGFGGDKVTARAFVEGWLKQRSVEKEAS